MSTYKDAGVDITRGNAIKDDIKKIVRKTHNPNVLADIGHFGGFFRLPSGYRQPVLVSSTDGVGTKLKVAIMMGRHDTVGEDLVNHSVNDILCCGAKPLFFLDYLGLGRVSDTIVKELVVGMARGCKANGVALVGGETAQMPGLYADGDYDLAGTIVGVVERQKMITGEKIVAGDVMIALPSNGLHTNGYSLARKILLERYTLETKVEELGCTIGEELLKVHRSYLKPLAAAMKKFTLKGVAHITGGGIIENTMRILPKKRRLRIDWNSWDNPPIFELIEHAGKVPHDEMIRTFNLGIGMILIVSKGKAVQLQGLLKEGAFILGEIT